MYDGRHASQLFTVRLWPEPAAEGETRWRGQVTHVLSGETRFFREWQALLDFLARAREDAFVARTGQPVTIDPEIQQTGEPKMSEESAQRHCLMISVDAGEGVSSSATIFYLDWLDDQGNPHREDLVSRYEGFTKLGADGWKLVQVIERLAAEGMDGPIPPMTHQYFTRPSRPKG